ncbi:MAG: PQQ-like beta-propeller repeat protein, partial [Armatimonadetes bacterium]|nr:PQQ-like beta-propeller repeat protein [Armatimonadota bacterium]
QGAVNFAVASSEGTSTSGKLITLFFRPKAGAAAGARSPLTFDPDQSKFVIAAATGTATKNAVPGVLIIGGANEFSVGLGADFGSASTDGTSVYAVDTLGRLIAINPATGNSFTSTGVSATRPGAPSAGRPVIQGDDIVVVTINGKIQVYNKMTLAARLNPAPGVALGATAQVIAAPAVLGGRIIFPDTAGNLHSTDMTGGAQTATNLNVVGTSSPALVDVDQAGPLAPRVVIGAQNSVLVLNSADLTPVTGAAIPTQGRVSSSPYVYVDGTGWVGDDTGRVYTFNVITGTPIGTAQDVGGAVRSSPFQLPAGAGVIVVANNGKTAVVLRTGTMVAGPTLTPPAGETLPAGQELFSFQQAPIRRGTTALVGDTLGNLHQVSVNTTTGAITAGNVRDFGPFAITALTSDQEGRVAFIINRSTLVQTPYTP